jgi:hypothetical protein|tara:strand:+ start:247 stop:615 length:369 start_codon:yes stop_codon:yes gene_type:complete
MRQTIVDDREIWVGNHSKLGVFIYDLKQQDSVDSDCMRIYLLEEKRTGIFKKDLFKSGISKQTESDLLEEKVNEYKKIFLARRRTHCYRCKQHLDSVNFSVCNSCKWIKCECNACGCGYRKF